MAEYASIAAARAAGATGTDDAVRTAVRRASAFVDRITRDVFDQRPMTVLRGVDVNGVVRLPATPLTITDVRVPGAPAGLPPITGYRLAGTSLYLGASIGGWDVLRNHDPLHYRGGSAPVQVQITGTFGRATVPADVAEATALLAASLTGSVTTVNAEGDADLGTPPQVPPLDAVDVTDPVVLGLLLPFTRPAVLVS